MKIRQSFVSNSSSSSFVIAYKTSEQCPHCGITPIDIVDLIRNYNDSCGDTELQNDSADEIVKAYQDDLAALNREKDSLLKRPRGQCAYEWSNTYLVCQALEDNQKEAEKTQHLLDHALSLIKNRYNIAAIRIGNHDAALNGLLTEQIKNKSVILLEGDVE